MFTYYRFKSSRFRLLKQNKIKVISLKGEFDFLSDIRATSEHTFGLILSLLRNYKNAISISKEKFTSRII